jgi:hypothetical protein
MKIVFSNKGLSRTLLRYITATLLLTLVVSGCSSSDSPSRKNSENAIALIKKVCDGSNKLNWQERRELAAQANALDVRWERISDALNNYLSTEEINQLLKENPYMADYGEQLAATVYQRSKEYSQFAAECSTIEIRETSHS